MLDRWPETPPLATIPSGRAKSRHLLLVFIILGFLGLGVAITGAVLYARHLFESTLVRIAKVASIQLSLGEVRYGLGFIQIFDSAFTLEKVPGASGTVKRVDVDFSGFHAERVLFSGIQVQAQGDPLTLYRASRSYYDQIKGLNVEHLLGGPRPKLEWQHLSLRLTSANPLMPSAEFTEVVIQRDLGEAKNETAIGAGNAIIGNVNIGALALMVREQQGLYDVGWGTSLADSPVTLTYRENGIERSVALAFRPTPVADLVARFNPSVAVPDNLKKATVTGTLSFLIDPNRTSIVGKSTLRLAEFLPPHPPELTGYAFASATRIEANFEADPLFLKAELPLLLISNGDIHLRGNGRIERDGVAVRVLGDVSTQLDCSTLAKGFSQSEVGGALGQWGARNAAKTIRGNVSVRLQMDANTRNLKDAKVTKSIGIGCGLRPLSIPDVLSLGLPPPPDAKAVEKLMKRMPQPGALPSMPNLLPSFGEILDVNINR